MKSRLRSFLSKPSGKLLIGLVGGLLGAGIDRLFDGRLSTWLLLLLGGLLIWLIHWLGSKSQFMGTSPHLAQIYMLLGAIIGDQLTWLLA